MPGVIRRTLGARFRRHRGRAGGTCPALRRARARLGTPLAHPEPGHQRLGTGPALPAGADLHLLTHSRGGLVGELLCLAERDRATDPLRPDLLDTLFAADRTLAPQLGLGPLAAQALAERDAAYQADRQALAELLTLLDEKKLQISRFLRVACPARGTTLASGRLDRWLSVFGHLGGWPVAADAMDFVLAVVKERTDPRTLPGLEAMMPGSALTRLLHHPDLSTSADLTVIAGDAQGDSAWSQLKLFIADWFYGSDHDLVVNTGSMFGGIRRPAGARASSRTRVRRSTTSVTSRTSTACAG